MGVSTQVIPHSQSQLNIS